MVIQQWHPTLPKSEIQSNQIYPVKVGEMKMILVNFDGSILAYRDTCPHEGFPLSVHGEIVEDRLVCNKHLWEFEGWSGEYIGRIKRPGCNLQNYETRENGGMIEVFVTLD